MRKILSRTIMNITLENFLKRIYGDRSGKVPMVWIYLNDSNFYPDEQGFAESELLAVYRSDFVPSMTFREDFCNNIVNEIYWTQNGIVVTVSETEKTIPALPANGSASITGCHDAAKA